MQMENRKFLKIMELYTLMLFFTDPLRFARPPNLRGTNCCVSISSPKLGEVAESQRGMLLYVLQHQTI